MLDRDSDTGLQRGFVKQRPNSALIASPVWMFSHMLLETKCNWEKHSGYWGYPRCQLLAQIKCEKTNYILTLKYRTHQCVVSKFTPVFPMNYRRYFLTVRHAFCHVCGQWDSITLCRSSFRIVMRSLTITIRLSAILLFKPRLLNDQAFSSNIVLEELVLLFSRLSQHCFYMTFDVWPRSNIFS